MNRRRDSEASGEVGLELPPALEAGGEGLLVGLAAGEMIEELPVAALRGAQIGEEVSDLQVVYDLQKTREPLADRPTRSCCNRVVPGLYSGS